MNYNGRLYGRTAGVYFDTGRTSADWDAMEKEIAQLKAKTEWINIKDRKPIALETGNWDGKRSHFVLVKNIYGNIGIARIYQGIIDDHSFCDFMDKDDLNLNNIVSWREIDRLS